ncbi:MAG: FecR domain-containing protein [Deltaproteobacteria bacterium]|nr:FecR domain-containing protein [Deltaproteobacteria bacterium]
MDQFEDKRKEGKKRSFFSMVKGKAMFYAMRLFRYKETRFRLKTPTAVVGVRGTQFGAHVYYVDEGKQARAGVQVADASNDVGMYLAQANRGQGGRPVTLVASGDGTVDVNGVKINPREVFNTDTNVKTFDPDNKVLNQIAADATVRTEGGAKAPEVAPEGETVVTDTGAESVFVASVDQTENLTKSTQQQVGEQTQKENKGFVSLPPPLYGYFSALLVYHTSASHPGEVVEAFASDDLSSLHPLNADANGVINSSNEMTAWEGSSDHGKVKVSGQTSSSFNITGPTVYLGQSSYLQWGYHVSENSPINVDIDNDGDLDYEVINKFWFVEGKQTTDFTTLSGDYNFKGDAHGTYYDTSGPVDVSGTYSSKVHFGSSYIQDFKLNASGGGHTVSIEQSGSATINSNGEFNIKNPNGTFKIDGTSVSSWRASGAHFGNKPASEQAGVWAGACTSDDKAAWGIFVGKQQK